MKSIKNIIAAFALVATLSVSSFAGILVTGRDSGEPCTPSTETSRDGILVTGATGILVTGVTGILVTGITGILVTGRDGILVTGRDGSNDTCGIIVGD